MCGTRATPNFPDRRQGDRSDLMRNLCFRVGDTGDRDRPLIRARHPLSPVRSHLGAGLSLAVSPVSRVTIEKSDGAARTSNLSPCKNKPAIALVGDEDGQLRVL